MYINKFHQFRNTVPDSRGIILEPRYDSLHILSGNGKADFRRHFFEDSQGERSSVGGAIINMIGQKFEGPVFDR